MFIYKKITIFTNKIAKVTRKFVQLQLQATDAKVSSYTHEFHYPIQGGTKKQGTKLLSYTTPNIDPFSELFHWLTLQ